MASRKQPNKPAKISRPPGSPPKAVVGAAAGSTVGPRPAGFDAKQLASAMVDLPIPERFELVAQMLRRAANTSGKPALDMTEVAVQLAAASLQQLMETQALLRKSKS